MHIQYIQPSMLKGRIVIPKFTLNRFDIWSNLKTIDEIIKFKPLSESTYDLFKRKLIRSLNFVSKN